MQRKHAQLRRQTGGLRTPIGHHARRADDEARPVEPAFALLDQEMGQRLHGLAEPHIVGEEAAELEGAQELQPVEPGLLIGAQLRLEPGGRVHRFDLGKGRKALYQCAQPLAAEPAQPRRRFDRRQGRAFAGRDLERTAGRQGFRVVELDERRQDRPRAFERQGDATAVGERAEDGAVMRQRIESSRARPPDAAVGSAPSAPAAAAPARPRPRCRDRARTTSRRPRIPRPSTRRRRLRRDGETRPRTRSASRRRRAAAPPRRQRPASPPHSRASPMRDRRRRRVAG